MAIRYDFEADEMGWLAQDYPGNQGIAETFHTNRYRNTGKYSLGLALRLLSHSTHYDQGETYVNILATPTSETQTATDFKDRQLRMSLLVPTTSLVKRSVGGAQLFLKDSEWRSLYGRFVDLSDKQGYWVALTLVPGKEPAEHGAYTDPGFDVHEIVAVGLKMLAAAEPGSYYEGEVYLDTVAW